MNPDEQDRNRRLYFKNLRKEQKKRRKERKKEELRRSQEERRKEQFEALVKNVRERVEAGEEPKPEENDGFAELLANEIDVASICPFPNVPVSGAGNCTATTKEQAERMDMERRQAVSQSTSVVRQPASSTPKLERERHQLTEINTKNIVLLGKTIGKGTVGTCQLADYRGMTVVLKQFTEISGKERSFERQKREVLTEAGVISKLGDHCGLPLLFGVQTQAAPCSIVLKFFGHKDTSVTIYRAACKKNFLSSDQWKLVVNHVCEALQHVHTKGYLHNDLKANNVVLEGKSRHFNPVIIDFGKSTKIDSPMKKKSMTKSEQKIYRQSFPHIAPEIINGTRTQTIASDVYSFAKLVQFLCDKEAVKNLGAEREILKNLALSEDPEARPQLKALLN